MKDLLVAVFLALNIASSPFARVETFYILPCLEVQLPAGMHPKPAETSQWLQLSGSQWVGDERTGLSFEVAIIVPGGGSGTLAQLRERLKTQKKKVNGFALGESTYNLDRIGNPPKHDGLHMNALGTFDSVVFVSITLMGPMTQSIQMRERMSELLQSAKWIPRSEMDKKLGLPFRETQKAELSDRIFQEQMGKVPGDSAYIRRKSDWLALALIQSEFTFQKYFDCLYSIGNDSLDAPQFLGPMVRGKVPAQFEWMQSLPDITIGNGAVASGLNMRSYARIFGKEFPLQNRGFNLFVNPDGKAGIILISGWPEGKARMRDTALVFMAEWEISPGGDTLWTIRREKFNLFPMAGGDDLQQNGAYEMGAAGAAQNKYNRLWTLATSDAQITLIGIKDCIHCPVFQAALPRVDTAWFDVIFHGFQSSGVYTSSLPDYRLFLRSPVFADTVRNLSRVIPIKCSGVNDPLHNMHRRQIGNALAKPRGAEIPPGKRLYISSWLSEGDRIFRMAVTNGILEFYQVFEAHGASIRELPPSAELTFFIRSHPVFLQMQKESMIPENRLHTAVNGLMTEQ